MTIQEYIEKTEYASAVTLEAIWRDQAEAERLHGEIERESKLVTKEYEQAFAMQLYAEDADDVMLGTARHWENYFGADKKLYSKRKTLEELKNELKEREDSVISLCGNLLEHAKKGLSTVYGRTENWPHGRTIGTQNLSVIIRQARNQSTHVDEAVRVGSYQNGGITSCFRTLESDINQVFGEYLQRDMGFEVIKALGWKDYESYKQDMLSFR